MWKIKKLENGERRRNSCWAVFLCNNGYAHCCCLARSLARSPLLFARALSLFSVLSLFLSLCLVLCGSRSERKCNQAASRSSAPHWASCSSFRKYSHFPSRGHKQNFLYYYYHFFLRVNYLQSSSSSLLLFHSFRAWPVFSHPSSSASSSSRPLLACFSSHHTLLSRRKTSCTERDLTCSLRSSRSRSSRRHRPRLRGSTFCFSRCLCFVFCFFFPCVDFSLISAERWLSSFLFFFSCSFVVGDQHSRGFSSLRPRGV